MHNCICDCLGSSTIYDIIFVMIMLLFHMLTLGLMNIEGNPCFLEGKIL